MAKIKKTRKDKKLTDQRKQIILSNKEVISVTKKSELTAKSDTLEQARSIQSDRSSITISTSGYKYLSQDLLKTTILTGSIIVAELVIKFYTKI